MPTTKIRISLDSVYVCDSADVWGDGEWHFTASIDGNPVGSPATEFVAQDEGTIVLPPADWSAEVDVSGKGPGDTVVVDFTGIDKDVLSDDDLGAVRATFAHPFPAVQITLISPKQKGFLLLPDHQYYRLAVTVAVSEEKATATLSGPGAVAVSRQADGSVTFSTVAGQLVPRVEICPVVPTPAPPSAMPRRPTLPAGPAVGRDTGDAMPLLLSPVPGKRNDLANPAVIPHLSDADPDLTEKAARIAVTFLNPGDLDVAGLVWTVKWGPVAFVGGNTGPWVYVRGTSLAGNAAADDKAEIEVRWGTDKGDPLATFRAWVGPVKTALYRVNVMMGSNPANSPTSILSANDINDQMRMARVLLWQVGIDLKPDPNTTCWDGATTNDLSAAPAAAGTPAVPLPAGMFMVRVAQNSQTTNVNINAPSSAGHLNFRPGVLNIGYIRNTPAGRAAAQDILGVPTAPPNERSSEIPTPSWVIPSGVAPDGTPANPVQMALFPRTKQASFDAAYTTKRKQTDPTFAAADLERLYSVVVPANWGPAVNGGDRGMNIAHEVGHALGLFHRGSGGHNNGAPPATSDDLVSSVAVVGGATKVYGHPWHENVMSYGYVNTTPPRSLDFDILQAPVMRRHPAVT